MRWILVLLTVLVGCISIPPYDRDEFGNFIDSDGDCQDTRAEMLIRDSVTPAYFKDATECVVESGLWFDLATGKWFRLASEVDADHGVSLGDAWRSGAWGWTREERTEFANDLSNLLPMEDGENVRKSDKGPDRWMPPNEHFTCRYITRYVQTKEKYSLSMTKAQLAKVNEVAEACKP